MSRSFRVGDTHTDLLRCLLLLLMLVSGSRLLANRVGAAEPVAADDSAFTLKAEKLRQAVTRRPRAGATFDLWYDHYASAARLDEWAMGAEQAARAMPEDARTQLVWGLVNERLARWPLAAAAFTQAAQLDERDYYSLWRLGEAQLRQGDKSAAAASLAAALSRSVPPTDHLPLARQLGSLYQQLGQRDAAVAVLRQAATQAAHDASVLRDVATQLQQWGERAAAEEVWQAAASSARDPQQQFDAQLQLALLRLESDPHGDTLPQLSSLLDRLQPSGWQATELRNIIHRALLERRGLEGTLAFWQQEFERQPNRLETLSQYAACLSQANRLSEAIGLYRSAVSRATSNRALREEFIALLVRDGQYDEAIVAATELTRLFPRDVTVWVRLGQLHLQQPSGTTATARLAALQSWRAAAAIRPTDAALAFQVAEVARQAAFASEQQLLEQQPQATVSARLRDEQQQLIAFAEEFYRAAWQRSPSGEYGAVLGEYLLRLGRREDALDVWRTMAAQAEPPRWLDAARMMQRAGDLTAATQAAEQAVAHDPDALATWQLLVELQIAQQAYPAALQTLDRCQAQRPNDDHWQRAALDLRIATRKSAGQLSDEVARARQVAAEHPNDSQAQWLLATLLQQSGDWSAAIAVIEPLALRDDATPLRIRQLAELLDQADRDSAAAVQYSRLIDVDPAHRREDYRRLIELQLANGQGDAAAVTAEQLTRRAPRDAESFLLAAHVAQARHDDVTRLNALERAADVAPRDVQVLRQYAGALLEVSRRAEAQAQVAAAFEVAENLAERLSLVQWALSWTANSADAQWLERQLQVARSRHADQYADWTECLIRFYQQTQQWEAAYQELDAWRVSRPTDARVCQQLVELALTTQRIDAAIRHQEYLVRLDRSPAQLEKLARLYRQGGQGPAADAIWDELLEERAAEPEAIRLVDDLLQAGDLYKAQTLTEAALSTAPTSWPLAYRAALIHVVLEQAAEARLTWTRLLQLDDASQSLSKPPQLNDSLKLLTRAALANRHFSRAIERRVRSGWRHPQTLGFLFDRDDLLARQLNQLESAQLHAAVAWLRGLATSPQATADTALPPLSADAFAAGPPATTRALLAAAWATQRDDLALPAAEAALRQPATAPLAHLIRLLTPRQGDESFTEFELRADTSFRWLQAQAGDLSTQLALLRCYLQATASAATAEEWRAALAGELAHTDQLPALLQLVPFVNSLPPALRREVADPLLVKLQQHAADPLPTNGDAADFHDVLRGALTHLADWSEHDAEPRLTVIARLLPRLLLQPLAPLDAPPSADTGRENSRLTTAPPAIVEWRRLATAVGQSWQADAMRIAAVRPGVPLADSKTDRQRLSQVETMLAVLHASAGERTDATGDPATSPPEPTGRYPVANRWLTTADLRLLAQTANLSREAVQQAELRSQLLADDAARSDEVRLRGELAVIALDWSWQQYEPALSALERLVAERPDDNELALQLALARLDQNQLTATRDVLQQMTARNVESPERTRIERALWERWSARLLQRELAGHEGAISSLAFSPLGDRLASVGVDGTVRLWDFRAGTLLQTLRGHTDIVLAVAFSPDGGRLVSGGYDRVVRQWNVADGSPLPDLVTVEATIRALDFAPAGHQLAIAGDHRLLTLLDLSTAATPRPLTGHTDSVLSVRFAPSGKQLASIGNDRTVRWWDVASATLQQSSEHPSGLARALTYLPTATQWLTGGESGELVRWSQHQGQWQAERFAQSGAARVLATVPQRQIIIVGRDDHHVEVLDATSGRTQYLLKSHTGRVLSVAVNPDGSGFASAGYDGLIKIWKLDESIAP